MNKTFSASMERVTLLFSLLFIFFSLTQAGDPYADSNNDGSGPPYKLDALKSKLYKFLHARELDRLRKEDYAEADMTKRENEENDRNVGNMDKLDLLKQKVSDYLEKKGIDLMNDKREEVKTNLNEDEEAMLENRQIPDEAMMESEEETNTGLGHGMQEDKEDVIQKVMRKVADLEMGFKRHEAWQKHLVEALREELGQEFFREEEMDEIAAVKSELMKLWRYVMDHDARLDEIQAEEPSDEMSEENMIGNEQIGGENMFGQESMIGEGASMTGQEMGGETMTGGESTTGGETTTGGQTTEATTQRQTEATEGATESASGSTTQAAAGESELKRKIAKLEKILVEDLKREVGNLKKRGYNGRK